MPFRVYIATCGVFSRDVYPKGHKGIAPTGAIRKRGNDWLHVDNDRERLRWKCPANPARSVSDQLSGCYFPE
jgi:hypothetical protein